MSKFLSKVTIFICLQFSAQTSDCPMKRSLSGDDGDMGMELMMAALKSVKLTADCSPSQHKEEDLLWDGLSAPSEGAIFYHHGYKWQFSSRLRVWWVASPFRLFWSEELGWGEW